MTITLNEGTNQALLAINNGPDSKMIRKALEATLEDVAQVTRDESGNVVGLSAGSDLGISTFNPINSSTELDCHLFIHPCTATAAIRYNERQIYIPIGDGKYYGAFYSVKGRSTNTAASIVATGIFAPAKYTWHGDAAITKSAGWTSTTNTSSFSGSYRYANAAGSSMSAQIIGKQISVATYLSTNGGAAIVSIDGDYTRANRLPTFTEADYTAGKCRESDIGKKYFQCHNSGTVVDTIPLADGLTDSAHTVYIEATGTEVFTASSDTRVYVEGFAGVSDIYSPKEASVHFVPLQYISYLETWSEHLYVAKFAPAGSTDYQFIGGIHGDGTTSKEAEVSIAVYVDGVDVTSAELGSYTTGRLIFIDHNTTRSHKADLDTQVCSVRRRISAAAKRRQYLMCVTDVQWLTAGTIKEEYPVMLHAGYYNLITKVTEQTLGESCRMGEHTITINAHDDSDTYNTSNYKYALISSSNITAWVEVESSNPDLAAMSQYRFRYADRAAGDGKLYMVSIFGGIHVAVGDVQQFVVGFGVY